MNSKKTSILECAVCKKSYWKTGSHSSCFKKYCNKCDIVFETAKLQQEHSKIFHIEIYCQECMECNDNLFAHMKNFHN